MRISTVKFTTSLQDYSSSRDQILKDVRQVKSNGRTVIGKYFSADEKQLINTESTLEGDFVRMMEFDRGVHRIYSQPVKIKYNEGGKSRTYVPDFLVDYRRDYYPTMDLKPALFEVKVRHFMKKNWATLKPKFLAAMRYADEQGWKFKIITEVEIRSIYGENAKFLNRFKNDPVSSEYTSAVEQIVRHFKTTTPFQILDEATDDLETRAELINAIWYMVSNGEIGCNIDREKLTMQSVIWHKTGDMFIEPIKNFRYVRLQKR